MANERGKYVVIEGHDGTGKSLQVDLLRKHLEEIGIKTEGIHEPAGAPIADELRKIIKNGELERDVTTNLLLFTAARRELWRQIIAPSLGRGAWVLAARNWISTIAYQGFGEGADPQDIETMTQQNTDKRYMQPDFTFILDLSDEGERARRISERGELEKPDTFESRDIVFQNNVKNGYLTVAGQHKFPIIDAGRSAEEVHQEIWHSIHSAL